MSSKYAVFEINGEEYGMDVIEVSTIEKGLSIKKMANSPDNVKGKVNLRGNDIPVYSLRKKMGIEDKEPDKDTRFLITDLNVVNVAIETDRIIGILDVEPNDMYDIPQVIKCRNNSYIKSIANMGDRRLILILDNDMLLDNEELAALQPKNKK